jgi:hypothetical protein
MIRQGVSVILRRRPPWRSDDSHYYSKDDTMRPRPAQWFTAVLLLFSGTALADPLGYAAGFNELYRVDLANGQSTRIGAVGFNDVEGLALSSGGTLYGVADATMMIGGQASATTDFLIRIDTATGVGTLVGPLGLQDQGPGGNLDYGLAFTCDGRLWLSSDTTGELWEVNRSSGATRRVGATGAALSGLAGRGNQLFGLGVDGGVGALYSIDPETAVATSVGPLASAGVVDDAGLDFDADGVLWATLDPEPLGSGPSRAARINQQTGRASGSLVTLTANTGIEGLAIAPTGGCTTGNGNVAPVMVPGPAAPLLWLLAVFAGLFGVRRLRRPA